MYIDHFSGGLDKTINDLCYPPSPLPPSTFNLTLPEGQSYVRRYTYLRRIDYNAVGPCSVVAFFHLLLDAPETTGMGRTPQEFLTYLLGTGLPCVLVVLVEAHRYKGKQHWLLTHPTFWLLMTQLITCGMTFPLYWLLLVVSRYRMAHGTRERPIASLITKVEAQGLALGLLLGAVLPSAAMVITKDTYATWLWQFYPVFVTAVRALYSSLAPSTLLKTTSSNSRERNLRGGDSRQSGLGSSSQTMLRTIYLATFFLSSFFHARAVWPRVWSGDHASLSDLLVLTKAPASDAHPSIQALSFFKWDYALSYLAFSLGLLWSARDLREVLGMLTSYAMITPVLGVGAATTVVLAWRDL